MARAKPKEALISLPVLVDYCMLSYTAKRIPYKGKEIQTYSFGEGHHVIFSFPGFPHSGLYYALFAQYYLKHNYKFIAFDLPGWCGWSDNIYDKEECCLDSIVDVAEAVLNYYNVKEFGLIGYSFGGALAIKLANRDISRIQRLSLVSPVFNSNLTQGTLQKQLVDLAFKLKASGALRIFIDNSLRSALPALRDIHNYQVVKQYVNMFKGIDSKIIMQQLHELFTTDLTVETKVLNELDSVLVINSEDEDLLFRKQADGLRSVLNNDKSLFIHGTHDDFLLRPQSLVVQQVMDYLIPTNALEQLWYNFSEKIKPVLANGHIEPILQTT